MSNLAVSLRNSLDETEQRLATANRRLELLEFFLRKALVELRTVRPSVEIHRDRHDFTVGTDRLKHLDAVIDTLEEALT